MDRKPDKTIADYLAIAICPVLIMAMVGSLIFFLLAASYAGPFAGRLRWNLFWFVLAMVLVSRIAIERGIAYAILYGSALAAVTVFMILMFIGNIPVVWCLLALIWWCAHKLTWDCTLINEDVDASGQGLLQTAGLDRPETGSEASPRSDTMLGSEPDTPPTQPLSGTVLEVPPPPGAAIGEAQAMRRSRLGLNRERIAGTEDDRPPPLPFPVRLPPRLQPPEATASQTQVSPAPPDATHAARTSTSATTRKPQALRDGRSSVLSQKHAATENVGTPAQTQPHAPGLWVIYFSLIALPVFGVGQGFIPAQDATARNYVLGLVVVYLAAALGLLLTTSFLGLRRYLRQRRLQMPPAIAGTWIGLGAGLALAVLVVCALLPRPNADWSVTALMDKLGSPPQSASRFAVLPGSPGEGKGRQLANPPNPNQPNEDAGGQPHGTVRVATPGQTIDLPVQPVAKLLAGLFRLAFVLLIVFLVFRNGKRLLSGLGQLLQDLLGLWRRLRGRPRTAPVARPVPKPRQASARPFAAYRNPFATGEAQGQAPAALVIFSFNALQAWAAGRGRPRRPEQTPLEFARELAEAEPGLADEAWQTGRIYALIAYAQEPTLPECHGLLESLWSKMQAAAPPTLSVER